MKWKHPAILFMICLVAAAVVTTFLPLPFPIGYPAHLVVGSVLVAAAFSLWILGARQMKKAQTPIEPESQPAALVTGGAFRISRNPLYAALVTTLLGIGTMVGSLWIVTGAAVLFLLLDRLVIPGEEKRLAIEFPADFRSYCRRVRRWV